MAPDAVVASAASDQREDQPLGTKGAYDSGPARHGNVASSAGWWPTRILLAIGIVSVMAIGVGLLAQGGGSSRGPP